MIQTIIYFLTIIILAFITGLVVKYSDYLEDVKKEKNKRKLVSLGLIYGILIFLMVYYFPVVAPIWIGTILGLIIFGKIDAVSHNVGVTIAITLSLAFAQGFLGLLLVFFVVINILEELVNDYFDKNKLKNKLLQKIIISRPLLEVSAFLVSLISGFWEIWVAIFFFDIAYQLITKYENKIINSLKKSKKS
jgi:hypothetical protein